jgi:hypothetical protein
MSDVLLGHGRKPLSVALPLVVEPRARAARPPPCATCRSACWWNGWRATRPVVLGTEGVERHERWLPRSKCGACQVSATVYPPGFYPQRQYQLDVVVGVVAAVELGDDAVARTAASFTASPRSAWRWRRWVGVLADAAALHALAAQVDPTSAPVATAAPATPTMAVIAALEVLGAALARAGLAMVERTGLGRVLGWQHRAHGVVVGVVAGPTRLSPAMAHGGRPATA